MNPRRSINLPDAIHHQLKRLAADERTTIQALILEAIKEIYGIKDEDN